MVTGEHFKKILIILPTYNECGNIAKMVEAVKSLDIGVAILIIDDNSPDGTGKIADELSREYKNITVIHRERKLGLGSAYIKGFKFALENKFEYICEMDADFSHDPRYLIDFYREIQVSDLVVASRYMNGISIVNWSFLRLVLSFFANKFVKFITGMPFTDCMGGYKCFRSTVISDIGPHNIISKGYVFQMEMLYRAFRKGYKIKEIPIIFYDRENGKSKMNKKEVLKAFFGVILLKLLLEWDSFFNRSKERKA